MRFTPDFPTPALPLHPAQFRCVGEPCCSSRRSCCSRLSFDVLVLSQFSFDLSGPRLGAAAAIAVSAPWQSLLATGTIKDAFNVTHALRLPAGLKDGVSGGTSRGAA